METPLRQHAINNGNDKGADHHPNEIADSGFRKKGDVLENGLLIFGRLKFDLKR